MGSITLTADAEKYEDKVGINNYDTTMFICKSVVLRQGWTLRGQEVDLTDYGILLTGQG